MILIAIGANLPAADGSPARTTCERAVGWLSRLPDLHLTLMSHWYESAPVPPSGQPSYVNGVARFSGKADPAALLAALQEIEHKFGRTRGVRDAARTLDLDIVAIGAAIRAAPDPILPHPRMHERAFVLRPLLDVAPDWVHPGLAVSARDLLARLPPQDIRPLPPALASGWNVP